MKIPSNTLLIAVAASVLLSLVEIAHGQSGGLTPLDPGLTCSPAPCVLPLTQASEGGSTVTESPIVASPANMNQFLLGSVDGNCSPPAALAFHLSTDGGSTWTVQCMPSKLYKNQSYFPVDEPSVGYDRKGTAYIAGLFFQGRAPSSHGFLGFQKSTDGIHWTKPGVALNHSGDTFPFETGLAVDSNSGSPWVNSVYVSGVMWSNFGIFNQVTVSHSSDGGATWTEAAIDPIQRYPQEDWFTRLAVGKGGTVYLTWLHCHGNEGGSGGLCPVVHMMFSKSIDGGNTWSAGKRMATVQMPQYWQLPTTQQRANNYPVIAVDDSDGTNSGNLYAAMYTWAGTYLRVQVIRSTDGGNTWSQPVPVAPPSATHDQFFPSISVSSTGQVGVSWLDRRNDPANMDYQAFAAISDDGGKTFQKNWQLTQAFSNPNTNGTGNNWMGDYTGNTWTGSDFIAAWMDSSNGVDMQEVVGGVRLK